MCQALRALTNNAQQEVLDLLAAIDQDEQAIIGFDDALNISASIGADGSFSLRGGRMARLDRRLVGLLTRLYWDALQPASVFFNGTLNLTEATAISAFAHTLMVGHDNALNLTRFGVRAASQLFVSLEGSQGAGSFGAAINVSVLSVNGSITIVGDESCSFAFPNFDNGTSVAASAQFVVHGGIGLSGSAGSAQITVGLQNSGSGASNTYATVFPGQRWYSNGTILGVSGARLLVRQARLDLGATLIEAAIEAHSGSTFSFQTWDTSNTQANNITFVEDNPSLPIVAQINATIDNVLAGAALFVGHMANCPASAIVQYNVFGSASAALAAFNITLLNYDSTTLAVTPSFTCTFQVCGSDGVCVKLHNPSSSSHANRRLLATQAYGVQYTSTGITTTACTGSLCGAASMLMMSPLVLALLAVFAMMSMRA